MPTMTSAPDGMVMIIDLLVLAPLLRFRADVVFAPLMPAAEAGTASSETHIITARSKLKSRFFIFNSPWNISRCNQIVTQKSYYVNIDGLQGAKYGVNNL